MDSLACQKFHISNHKRRLIAHEAKCFWVITGFTPLNQKGRFVYRAMIVGYLFENKKLKDIKKK